MQSLVKYLIGTGGWAYFNVPKPSLKVYSEIFNFVEVNCTFYEYPDVKMIERWRRIVPRDFTFSVRCHHDLTHRIGLKPVSEAYHVFNQMTTCCRILDAPFLVLETPSRYVLDQKTVEDLKDFLFSIDLKGIRLVWEIRSSLTPQAAEVMQDFNVVHCVDLSRAEPAYSSEVVYTRLFGKGKHTLYQFTDEELMEIDQKILKSESKTAAAAYHGTKMDIDAARFMHYKETGTFLPVTSFTNVDSVEDVLSEDARFPSSREKLIENHGWKVVDWTSENRIHLSELLSELPKKTYNSISEVLHALREVPSE